MRVQTKFREVLAENGVSDVSLCLYPLNWEGDIETRDLFHYHIEKSGGMAVGTALRLAARVDKAFLGRKRDWIRGASENAHMLDNRRNVAGQIFATYVCEPSGLRFGAHYRMNPNALPFAWFRDPFDRLVSHYCYNVRRGAVPYPASKDGFAAFIRDPENVCFQTKMMAESEFDGSNEGTLLKEALINVRNLAIADMHHRMEYGLLQLWTLLDLPAVITERLHVGSDKPFDFEEFRGEVERKHWSDFELIAHVRDEPRNLFELTDEMRQSPTITPWVGLLRDTKKDEHAELSGRICKDAMLVGILRRPEISRFRDLFEAIPE